MRVAGCFKERNNRLPAGSTELRIDTPDKVTNFAFVPAVDPQTLARGDEERQESDTTT